MKEDECELWEGKVERGIMNLEVEAEVEGESENWKAYNKVQTDSQCLAERGNFVWSSSMLIGSDVTRQLFFLGANVL